MQRNLGANAGLDWAGLGALLRCVAEHSLVWLAAAEAPASASGSAEQPAGKAAAPAPAAAAGGQASAAVQQEPALCSRGYHALRLQRAAQILQELLAEQRWLDGGDCGCAMRAQWEVQAAKDQPAYHAAEIAANTACLKRITQQLHAMGLDLL